MGGRGRAVAEAAPAWQPHNPRRAAPPPPHRKKWHRALLIVSLVLALVAVPAVLVFGVWPYLQRLGADDLSATLPWARSSRQTAANADYDAFATQKYTVDPAFQAYYGAHAGTDTLGTPVTPAFATSRGIVQFFAEGALLAPAAAPRPAGTTPGDTVLQILGARPGAGTATATPAAGGVARLPVLPALLTLGSKLPALDGAATTFVDLRAAASPDAMIAGTAAASPPPAATTAPVFVAVGKHNGHTVGHNIAPAFWAYINQQSVSPGGWQADIGLPVTEALPVTVTQAGATHHLLVQAFWYAVLTVDSDATAANGQPGVSWASAGLAYLRSVGPPTVAIAAGTAAWGAADAPILDVAATGAETVHIGQNYPLTLSGEATWKRATLWYGASWASPKRTGKGYIAAGAVTLVAPDKAQPAHASFDVLDADLATYMKGQGKNLGVAVYDITRNTYYGYNDTQPFVLASTAKLYIMASYLDWLEGQGRGPRSDEVASLTAMIENSDNNAAQLLYNRVGYDAGQRNFLKKVGITDYVSCPDGWGCAALSASDAAHLLALLQQGKILNDSDRQLAFSLLSHIEADQRFGVGDTAPQGATVYMKNGWLPYPDVLWDLNTTGIVVAGNEAYSIAVYSQNQQSPFGGSGALDVTTPGLAKLEHICGAVGKLLT